MRDGLAALLCPMPAERFLRRHWPSRHAVIHGPPARLKPLRKLPQLAGLEPLLESWRGPVMVLSPGARDESDSYHVKAAEAAAEFGRGRGLVFEGADRVLRPLGSWLDGVRRDLGLPSLTFSRCLLYATPAGGGVSPHFDANANLIIQLTGAKRWRLARNASVENPTLRYALSMGRPSAELASCLDAPLPARMPSPASAALLRPGSVLFLPRGMWHATSADRPSLSLNFTFSQPTWADVVLEAFRRRLLRDARWRALADGVAGAPVRRRAAEAALGRLLDERLGALGVMEPARLLEDALGRGPAGRR